MRSPVRIARLAGLLYTFIVVTGIFSLMYVPSKLYVHGDVVATIDNILASESLFRFGILVNVISHVAFLLLPFVLYALLASVNRAAAVAMVVLATVSVPLDLLAIANQLDIVTLLHDDVFRNAATPEATHAAVRVLMDASRDKITLSEMFWGLWLLPFGYLVYKSGFLPKIIGIFLMLGCFSYMFIVIAQVVAPTYDVPGFVMIPASIGEIGIALWLLVFGVRQHAAA